MKKEFVPYELSLDLKNKGFDDSCFGYWSNFENDNKDPKLFFNQKSNFNFLENIIPAPTFSQVFRWFREKHDIFVQPNKSVISGNNWYYFVITTNNVYVCEGSSDYDMSQCYCVRDLLKLIEK